jgi:O-antigen/teichoic acid export membrane protein
VPSAGPTALMTDTEITIAVESSRSMLRTAHSLMLNTIVNAALGVGFWIVAARLYHAEIVGRDGALISAMAAISALCGMNMNNNIIRFLPSQRARVGRMVLSAYGVAAVAVAGGAVAFVLLVPAISHQFAVLSDRPRLAGFYAASVVAWTIFGLQDVVLTSVRRASWVPIENAAYGAAKLALLPVCSRMGITDGILLAWIVPMLVLLLPVNGMLFARWLPMHAREPAQRRSVFRSGPRDRLIKFVAQDTVATALGMASRTLLPSLAVVVVGSRSAAHFYVPFTIISTLDLLFTNATTSLVAEGARGEVSLQVLAQTTLRRFMPMLLLATASLIVVAPWVLALFGSQYAHGGATVLRVMAAASAFRAVMMVGIAVARLQRQGLGSLMIQGGSAALLVLFVPVFAPWLGLNGVALAWLASSVCGGIATLPYVLRTTRDRPRPEAA